MLVPLHRKQNFLEYVKCVICDAVGIQRRWPKIQQNVMTQALPATEIYTSFQNRLKPVDTIFWGGIYATTIEYLLFLWNCQKLRRTFTFSSVENSNPYMAYWLFRFRKFIKHYFFNMGMFVLHRDLSVADNYTEVKASFYHHWLLKFSPKCADVGTAGPRTLQSKYQDEGRLS